jgi:hypothetical protein
MMARHDRYLRTGQGKLPESEYRKAAHLALEYLGDDDERVQRMSMSYNIMGSAQFETNRQALVLRVVPREGKAA